MEKYSKIKGIITLLGLKGIGPAFIKKIISENALDFMDSDIIGEIKNILTSDKNKKPEQEILQALEKAEEIIYKCEQEDIKIIDYTNELYPILLKELKAPPPILYCRGNINLFHHRTVCIIGTREPNEVGIKISERIGKYYSENDWTICNGLAEGIDTYAIKENEHYHSKIIGVLAGGLDFLSKNTLLKNTAKNAENVLKANGLLISEVPPNKKEDTFTVVKSCRIQAGISDGLILVQSSLNGGSRFTVKSFSETKRPLAIIHPILKEIELPICDANKEIIQCGKKGLAKYTELKEEKIRISEIFPIKSKEDYTYFENLMITNKDKPLTLSLFD